MPDTLPEFVDHDGEPRKLACLAPRPDFGNFRAFASANPLISRDQWRDLDLMARLPGVPVLDQGRFGSCVGHGSATAFWMSYLLLGGTVPPGGFSPTSVYALVNGGRDNGAVVSDAMDAMIESGVGLMSEIPESVIFERQIPPAARATRRRFRVLDAYHCSTFDAIGSALQLGFPVSFGIMLPGGFNRLDDEGVAGLGWGVLGGHCMAAYGTKRLSNGKWAIRVRNSWGARWGKGGDCLLVEQHFGRSCDAFAIRAAISDPLDPRAQPVAA